jgi:hypothetical protein
MRSNGVASRHRWFNVNKETHGMKKPTLAPDGTFVNGTPRRTPDGKYVGDGGPITLAPDGTYVAGTPRLTPDGKYVGDGGPITQAPDGTFVAGLPVLTPDGKFI